MKHNRLSHSIGSAVMFSIVLLSLTFHIRVIRASEGAGTWGGRLSSVHCEHVFVYICT